MRLEALLYLYGRRLRSHPIQELMAGAGIAIGVALAFAVMVANGSVVRSSDRLVRSVVGTADLQLTARTPTGFDHALIEQVRAIPGVAHASPLLEQRAVIVGPGGRQVSVAMAGIEPSLVGLSGRLPSNLMAAGLQAGGVVLPSRTARLLGLPSLVETTSSRPIPDVSARVRGRSVPLKVTAVLGPDTLGSLADAQIAILPLPRLQTMTGLPGRVSRILVDAQAGRTGDVRTALERLAAGRLTVSPAGQETTLLRSALGPAGQATAFFAAISAFVGFLLAFNAMLLTAPERRRLIAELRVQGVKPRQLVALVMSQAVVLGATASIVGVLIGNVLARTIFDQAPDYLAPPFTLGDGTVVGITPILVAFLGGIAASCLAAAPPLFDLRRGRAVDAIFHGSTEAPGQALGTTLRTRFLMGAIAALAVASGVLLFLPSAALAAAAALGLATVLAIPSAFALALHAADRLSARLGRTRMLHVALLTLRATTLRSLALAATGAVAVFGCVAIGGARSDLLRGISDYTADYVGTADIWVVNPNDNQATNDLRPGDVPARIEALTAVADVREYHGSFLDVADRRVWVIARPSGDDAMLPASQIVDGDLELATERVRGGGWVAVSDQIAREKSLGIGDAITWSTPAGERSYRLAATTTNLGWSPGALMLNSDDYRSAWATTTPTALEVDLEPGADAEAAKRQIQGVLGPSTGLVVHTADERAEIINASARQGLNRLSQISALLLVAAVLAMAAAMGAAIWQRRAALAALRVQSFSPRQLLHLLLIETGIVLLAGCLTGALIGMYGQIGADRFLNVVTGFPVAPVPAGWQTVQTVAIVITAALAVIAVPSWFASRVPPHLGLQE